MSRFSFYIGLIACLVCFGLSKPVFALTTPPAYVMAAVEPPRDSDGDGLSNQDEIEKYFTDPLNFDTDNDGMGDGDEIATGTSPRHVGKKLIEVDSDKDYLNDAWELILGTGLMNPDSDGDLYLDGTEVASSHNPLDVGPELLEKLIEVSVQEMKLRYFMGGILMGEIPVSTGKSWTPTPTGEFRVLDKIPMKDYIGPTWNYPDTPWNLRFTFHNGWNYYIHSAYWHNNFGKAPVSGGCVNVREEDMEPLYWWAQHGTRIVIE